MDKKLILIVEDDKAYTRVYKTKLESEGYEVVIAHDGDAGLRELRQRKFCLLVLDLVMPGKNGFDLLVEIRMDDTLKNMKVIVATNLSQDVDKEKAKKFGVDYFVKSDISVCEMVEKIKNAISAP